MADLKKLDTEGEEEAQKSSSLSRDPVPCTYIRYNIIATCSVKKVYHGHAAL